MHILFITPKWMRNDPDLGVARGIDESFMEYNAGTYSTFHPDEFFYEHKHHWDLAIIEKVVEEKPDLICYTWINTQYNPHLEVFSIIHKMKIPIVCWWWDFFFMGSIQIAQELSPFINVHLTVDTPIAYTRDVHRSKYKPIWPLPIKSIFFNSNGRRTIQVSFPGGTIEGDNKGPRAKYLNYLKDNGIDIFIGGTKQDESIMEYANNLRKTKLVLNITPQIQVGENKFTYLIKGRTFEALSCGAALLEPTGSMLEYYLRPNTDYITYDNEEDLLEKIKYYTDHEAERLEIAETGYNMVEQKYSISAYWQTIFNYVKESLK